MNKIKTILNEKTLAVCVAILICMQPIIDMDYLFYDFLDQLGLPRFSTIIRFLIIPAMLVWVFWLHDKNKKKTLIFGGTYVVIGLIYFVLHVKQGYEIYDQLYLTTNFYFNWFQELTYVLTLVLPYGLIYILYQVQNIEKLLKFSTIFISAVVSVPILIGDLVPFGMSTYEGFTRANFLSWFTGGYATMHPRVLTSKFFFKEGNTIGILMFILLPILFHYFHQSQNKKERIGLGALIVVQCLSMIILGTRVGTYGAVIMPMAYFVMCVFFTLMMKTERPDKAVLALALACTCVFGFMVTKSPAVENQKIDSKNDLALLDNDYAIKGLENDSAGAENLVPGSTQFNYFYIHMFEEYGIRAKYATSIPKIYYEMWYSYKFDPKYWVDVLFLPLEQRVGGRNIQKLFMDYKWNVTNHAQTAPTPMQKMLGMGYSTFMNGSILIEKDFVQQMYTLGYVGDVLTLGPWIGLVLVGAFLVLKNWKKHLTLENCTLACALCAGLGSGYISGHTLDQFITTTFMALIVAVLLRRVLKHGE